MHWTISLSGEIHTDWRQQLEQGSRDAGLHDEAIVHPLKEVDAAAMAWAQTPAEVVDILKYVTSS